MRTVLSVRVLSLAAACFAGASLLQAQAPVVPHTRLLESYGRLPLHFEQNQGQVDPQVKFLARGSGYSLFLTPTQAVLALRERGTSDVAALRFTLAGANPRPVVTGRDELPGKINYFVGNDSARWRTNIATYARVHYRGVYPGIDLVYYGNQRQLEYDFVVAPGADPGRIRMSFEGARDLRIDASGDLILHVAGGDLRQYKPVVYQDVHGVRQQIAGRYVINERRHVGFELGVYDETRPLVIDPILVYSTYLGGASVDEGNDIAVDAAGNAYVTGETNSGAFPTTAGAFDTALGSIAGTNRDAFVTKLGVTGSTLVYSTYLGGSGNDDGNGIAVDAFGHAYVTGSTTSDNFPVTSGAFDTMRNGQDAFVVKLNPTGSARVYATFLGGTGADIGNDIAVAVAVAVDSVPNAYVTGQTFSSAASATGFPATLGAVQSAYGGAGDAFVTKVNPAGTGLVYSTYVGGTGIEIGNGVGLDPAGHAYVTGETRSTDFPAMAGAFDTNLDGASDAFLAKLDLTGSSFVYSTYLGGTSTDLGHDVVVDALLNAHVTGQTSSGDFPTTLGAFQAAYGGGTGDAFVTTVSGSGGALLASTYLGGSAADHATGIAVDSALNAYVTGQTSSTADFPTTPDAVQPAYGGGTADAFVTKLNPAGSAPLIHSTYLGGSAAESGNGIAVDLAGDSYVTGSTGSMNFPTTAGAFDTSFNGSADAFVAKIEYARVPAVVTLDPPEDINPVGSEHCVTATVEDALGNPVPGVTVRFTVIGAANTTGSATTDDNGHAVFCYTGPVTPGADAISAFADTDNDSTQDIGEPGGGATKAWVPGAPATLTLTPATDTNPVAGQHCVTATVKDAFGNVTPGITVRFQVTGAVNTSGSAATNADGQATFCYTGPAAPGGDAISAFADTDNEGTQGAGEPSGAATKAWVPGAPATLVLTPAAASNPVGTQHCVTATVRDAFGNATPGITVRFHVTGAVITSGSATTDASGEGDFCYAGPLLSGADTITAYADTDNDGVQNGGEPTGAAVKTWVAASAAECKVTGGGYITTATGGRAIFAGNAWSHDGGTGGKQEYFDRGREPRMRVRSLNVLGVVCRSSTEATIFGEALVNDSSRVQYRIDVKDMGEPGRGNDWYSILLSDGYASGEQILKGGNIQIH